MDIAAVEGYLVRGIRADEWERVKELRLDALRDPVARIAFLETYEDAVAKDDGFWRERAERSGEGSAVIRQFVAEGADGSWAGSVTVLLEEAGSTDWSGQPAQRRQGHVVGVFVRPGHRGNGLIQALLESAAAWSWERDAERVRLFVHEANARAQGAYRRAGFAPTGLVVAFPTNDAEKELEFARERQPLDG